MDQLPIANRQSPITCLTIAGLDPSGGAGIVADIKTFSAFGCFAAAAVTSLTFQNTQGVFGAVAQTAGTVRGQVEPVLDDLDVAALKTGMLPTREVIEEVARLVGENDLRNFVVDPVVRSTSGFDLIDDAALAALIEKLFPLADLVTPNVPEAERITGLKIASFDDVERAARQMRSMGARNVVIKGGHLPLLDFGLPILDVEEETGDRRDAAAGDREAGKELAGAEKKRRALDFLYVGDDRHVYAADYIETTATHGTGCTFAAAITANLGLGRTLAASVATAKRFVTEAIRTAPHLGRGHSPINQLLKDFA